jgi:hypothetical protein
LELGPKLPPVGHQEQEIRRDDEGANEGHDDDVQLPARPFHEAPQVFFLPVAHDRLLRKGINWQEYYISWLTCQVICYQFFADDGASK